MTGSPSDTSEPPLSEKPGSSPRFVHVFPPSELVEAPSVPTFGKKEQSLAAASGPRTGPGPNGGCSCSSLAPAIRSEALSGSAAMVGSFCLLVGKTAVLLLFGCPATCGLFACTSIAEVAPAGTASSSDTGATASNTRAYLARIGASLPQILS